MELTGNGDHPCANVNRFSVLYCIVIVCGKERERADNSRNQFTDQN